MTTIQFYHLLSTTSERAVPKLMEKALSSGARVIVKAGSDATLKALSDALWTNDPDSFIPHGRPGEAHASRQPILLTMADENPNKASILCLLEGVSSEQLGTFDKVLDVFDGSSDAQVAAARARWSRYKQEGYALQYVKQQPGGGWKIEAQAA